MSVEDLLGIGLYSVPEAARISKVPSQAIRRWVRGYYFPLKDGTTRTMPPLWQRDIGDPDAITLTFRDLLEVRLVSAFRNAGVTWPVIRRAAVVASEVFETTHPFCTRQLVTDGQLIFAESREQEKGQSLLDLFTDQYAFRAVVEPFLVNLEFDEKVALRWWPLGENRQVVLDPERGLGRPLANNSGVPTEVLASGYRIEGSYRRVAHWYGIEVRDVKDAVEYETEYLAA